MERLPGLTRAGGNDPKKDPFRIPINHGDIEGARENDRIMGLRPKGGESTTMVKAGLFDQLVGQGARRRLVRRNEV